MDLMLDGRTVLVTGGSSGVGLATVAGLVDEGANVVTCARRLDVLEKTLADRGLPEERVLAKACDVRDEHAVRALVAAAEDRFGGLDGLVNNAAITNSGGRDAHQLEIDMWDRVMDVNVRGSWLMGRACRPALAESGRGAIVNLASDTALWGAPNLLAYASSKGAVIAMTRSLAREWGGDNITVNAVAPGLTLVEATEYVPMARHQKYLEGRAIPREQQAADVCGATLFLLSGLSRFVTGQLLAVNGGFAMH